MMVERLFLALPRGCLRFVIVEFPDHTHFLFFKPPSPHKGSAVFLNIGLTQTCIAIVVPPPPPPHMGTLPKHQKDDKDMQN